MTEISLPRGNAEFGATRPWLRLKATLKVWQQRSRERRFLAQMSPYQRAELSVPPRAIEREIAKPFWRA